MDWVEFFQDAGLDPAYVPRYAVIFEENRIRPDMLNDLNHEYLTDMGILAMGDKIAILKHAKNVSEALKQARLPVHGSPECPEPESVHVIIAGPSTPTKAVLPQLPTLMEMELVPAAPKKKLELLSPLEPVPVIQEDLDQSDCLELEPIINDFDIDMDRPTALSELPKVLFVDKSMQQVARIKDVITIRSRSSSPSNRKSSNGNNVWKDDVGAKSHQRIQNQNGVVSPLPRDDRGRDVSAERDQEAMPRVKSKVQVVQPQQLQRNQSAHRSESSSSAVNPDQNSRHSDHIGHRLKLLASQEMIDQDYGGDYDYKERTSRRPNAEYDRRESSSGYAHDTASSSRRSSGYSGSSIARGYLDRDRDRRSRSGETSSRSTSRSRHQEDLPGRLTNSFGHLDSARSYVNRNNKYSDWGTGVSLHGSSSRSESGHNRHREYDDEYSHRGSRSRGRHSGDRDRVEAESGQQHATKRHSEPSREPEYVPRDHDRGRDRDKSRSRTNSPPPPPPGSGSKVYETLDSRYQCKSAKISRNYDGPSKLDHTFFH